MVCEDVRAVLALGIAAGCGFAPQSIGGGADARDADGPDAMHVAHYRKQITIAASSPTQLVDFPVSIVATDADLASHARADGSDIAMTALDGTPLAFELVSYAAGALEAWVRIPAVTASTDIYMIYGGATAPLDSAPTWLPHYAGVWP